MKETATHRERKHIEEKLSQIGAQIANATELSRQAKEMARKAEAALIVAQEQVDFLYTSLGDDDAWEVSQ